MLHNLRKPRCGALMTGAVLFAVALFVDVAHADQSSTQVRLFSAFGPEAIHADLTIKSRASGSCWTSSLADSGRPDAYRCMVEHSIIDPCFRAPSGLTVVCPDGPFSHAVVVISLKRAIPRVTKAAETEPPPWGLRLANGLRCSFLTGATWVEGGMRANYSCGKGYVFGEPDRAPPGLWHIFYKASLNASDLQRVGIVEAVF
jgi:hypothetical protein